MTEHPPAQPLSIRAIQAEWVAIKRRLDEMADEDDKAPHSDRPWLGDWLLFPTPESRAAEIERWHAPIETGRRSGKSDSLSTHRASPETWERFKALAGVAR